MVHESEGSLWTGWHQGMRVRRESVTFLPFPEGLGLSGSGVTPVGAAVEGGLW